MTENLFDVVTVPDFSGSAAHRFEIMTLFFLASWIEFGGRSRDLPLHIACIGVAPESVRFLADQCGAEITSHSPDPLGKFGNKLLGFEVNQKTDHLLLLDSDMLVLSELNDLPSKLGRDCIAAGVSNGPFPASINKWPKIYEMLGLPIPTHQVVPLNLELDTFQCVPFHDRKDFPPLYNGGIVYAPWRSELGKVWRDHMTRIVAAGILRPRAIPSNQPSLATAIALLQGEGFKFKLLPDEYHVRWQHLATGAVSSRRARLFHTIGFAQQQWSKQQLLPIRKALLLLKLVLSRQKVHGHTVSAKIAMENFHSVILNQTKIVRSHRGPANRSDQGNSAKQMEDCHRLHRLIKRLYYKHVRELMP